LSGVVEILKVCFTDGTLDVGLLQVSDSTVRIGVARRGRRGGLEGLAPPCGQLTRCFSAVAELLVLKVTIFCQYNCFHSLFSPRVIHIANRSITNANVVLSASLSVRTIISIP